MSNSTLILVVDDHETQRILFKVLAERLGIAVHVVASGAEALEAVETYQFDAILMDVRMPGMDGLDCTKKIREMEKQTGRHTPIIASTACCFPSDQALCAEAGMDDFLGKPFTLEQLKDKLNKWTISKISGNHDMKFSSPPRLEELEKFRRNILADLAVAEQLAGPQFKEERTMKSALEFIDENIENLRNETVA